jgi:hypothetical protein
MLDFKVGVMPVKVTATSETEMHVIGQVWPNTEDTKSKCELGSDYNIAPVANLEEWDVQAAALEACMVGQEAGDLVDVIVDKKFPFDDQTSIGVSVIVSYLTRTYVEVNSIY